MNYNNEILFLCKYFQQISMSGSALGFYNVHLLINFIFSPFTFFFVADAPVPAQWLVTDWHLRTRPPIRGRHEWRQRTMHLNNDGPPNKEVIEWCFQSRVQKISAMKSTIPRTESINPPRDRPGRWYRFTEFYRVASGAPGEWTRKQGRSLFERSGSLKMLSFLEKKMANRYQVWNSFLNYFEY